MTTYGKTEAWCPDCRERVATEPRMEFPNGQMDFWLVFGEHGCTRDGKKVRDFDFGFVRADGSVVPEWEEH